MRDRKKQHENSPSVISPPHSLPGAAGAFCLPRLRILSTALLPLGPASRAVLSPGGLAAGEAATDVVEEEEEGRVEAEVVDASDLALAFGLSVSAAPSLASRLASSSLASSESSETSFVTESGTLDACTSK